MVVCRSYVQTQTDPMWHINSISPFVIINYKGVAFHRAVDTSDACVKVRTVVCYLAKAAIQRITDSCARCAQKSMTLLVLVSLPTIRHRHLTYRRQNCYRLPTMATLTTKHIHWLSRYCIIYGWICWVLSECSSGSVTYLLPRTGWGWACTVCTLSQRVEPVGSSH